MLRNKVLLNLCIFFVIGFIFLGCVPSDDNINALELKISELESENNALKQYYLQSIAKLELKINELEGESASIKEHYSQANNVRNTLDIKSRKIYDALKAKDTDFLKTVVSQNAEVLSDGILFHREHPKKFYLSKYYTLDTPFVLRQRFYMLSSDKEIFTTGYEILMKDLENIPVVNFTFIKEEGKWKLSFITEE